MNLIYRRSSVYVSLLGTIAMLGHALSLWTFGDTRIIDYRLSWEALHWWEILLLLQGLMLTFILFLATVYHSSAIAGKKVWSILIVLFWPLAFVYAWLFFPNDETAVNEGISGCT